MSSSSSDGGEFVAGTPAKARPVLAAPPKEGGRFARGPPLAPPATVWAGQPAAAPVAGVLTGPALQRVTAPAGRAVAAVGPAHATLHAPLAGRFSAPSLAEPASRWAGQGSSLLQRGAGGFSRIAQERQKAHGAPLETPAPPHRSEPSCAAAAAVGSSMHASVSAPPPRAEARSAPAAAAVELCAAPPRTAPDKRPSAGEAAAEGRPPKRARPAPGAAARPSAPRAGSTRDNFVRLQLGKAGRCKGAGGRKFVTGASKPYKRSRKASRSAVQLPDSTAEASPLIQDDNLGTALLPARGSRPQLAPVMPAKPAVVFDASALLAEADELLQAARGEPTEQALSDILRVVFGFQEFRDGQLQAIQHTLAGHACLAILPTGQGKSLCYQLSALILPGVTLVVSPLVALMEDQLTHLPKGLPGAALHSSQSPEHAAAVVNALRAGSLKILFIAPERLLSRRFLELAASLPADARITFACVDECHCVSEWSHNFRPAYYHLGRVLRAELGLSRILALTATATRRTETAVVSSLGIASAHIIRAACMRANLRLTVSRESKRDAALLAMLRPGGRLEHVKSVIAYASYKAESDRLAQFLFTNNIRAVSYHAGKSPAERMKVQTHFQKNLVRVVVATVAFGMGLDKSDVGAVVNVGMPRSIEAYVQQVGRAGRDGTEAQCHTFIDDDEFLKLRSLTFSDGVDESDLMRLLKQIFLPDAVPGMCSAIVVQTAEAELGLRQEVVETVLSYLELGEGLPDQAPMISALPDMCATLQLAFHKSDPQELAATNELVEHLLKAGKERQGKHTVSIPLLAHRLRVPFTALQDQLRQLSEAGEVSYTSSDRALCLQIRRMPSDVSALAAALAARLRAAEQCQVGKLDCIFSAAVAAAQHKQQADQELELRRRIAAYFEAEGAAETAAQPELVKQNTPHLISDIRALLRQAGDVLTNGRAIARVLHGLAGPHINADVWRRNPAWGKHISVDFNAVMQAADAELAAARR